MLKNISLGILLASVFALLGCSTVSGFGQDVSKVGDKIEKKADEVKK